MTNTRAARRRLSGATFAALAPALSLAAFLTAPVAGHAQDLIVDGCSVLEPGQVGIFALVGDIGEQHNVPVTVRTNGIVDALWAEIEFPTSKLQFVSASKGNLTSTFELFAAVRHDNHVRILALNSAGPPIASGAQGMIAVLRFQITSGGTAEFDLPVETFDDDLAGYGRCDPSHTSGSESASWGEVRSRYR